MSHFSHILKGIVSQSSGLEVETTAYRSMVESDGGTVQDIVKLNEVYKYLKLNSLLGNLVFSVNAFSGLKLVGSDIVTAYSLVGTNHAIGEISFRPTLNNTEFNFNGAQRFIMDPVLSSNSPMTIMARIKGADYSTRTQFVMLGGNSSQTFGTNAGVSHAFVGITINGMGLTANTEYNLQVSYDQQFYRHHTNGIVVNGAVSGYIIGTRSSIGCQQINGGSFQRYFTGTINDIYIFDKALSQAEMQGILNNIY